MISSFRSTFRTPRLRRRQNLGVFFAADDPPLGGAASTATDDAAAVAEPATDEPAGADRPGDASDRDWKAEYLREAAQSRKYRQRAQKAETELEQLRPRALPPEQHEEYQRLRLAADDLAAKDARIERLTAAVRELAGLSELHKTLAACGVGRGCANGERMLAQAAALLGPRIRVELDDDQPAVRVLDENGAVQLDPADESPVSVRNFVADWLAREGSHFLPPSHDTGSGARGGFTAPPAVDIRTLDRDPRAKADFIARHGPAAYLQLAQRRQT